MDKPEIAQKGSYAVELTPGKYYWCACGRSQNQPFCDGSHKVTPFKPVAFEITESKKVFLCGCKQTQNRPFCDGSHKKL